ncbi:MAG: TlpA family protein disulfide reductase [Nocardioides sp.]
MTAGAWVLVVAVVGALAFGLYRASVDGRFRGTHAVRQSAAPEAPAPPATSLDAPEAPPTTAATARSAGLDLALGEKATLLQFSSAFCAPCRATRRTLSEVATAVPGVVHVEVDAEHHLEVVRALGVLRTPTTLVLDASGAEVTRAAGAPRKEQVLSALGALA